MVRCHLVVRVIGNRKNMNQKTVGVFNRVIVKGLEPGMEGERFRVHVLEKKCTEAVRNIMGII